MGTDKWYKAAIYVAGMIFIVSFLWNGIHNRPAHDDFEFLTTVKEFGITGAVGYYYDNWNTRWAAIFIANIFYYVYENSGTFFPFHLATLIVWTLAIYSLVRNIFRKNHFESGAGSIFLITGCTTMGTFFVTHNIADSFYWVNTSAMYLWNLIAFTLFAASYFGFASKPVKLIVAVITGIYIGGGGETFTVMIIICILTLLLANIKFRMLSQPKLILTFLVAVSTGFLVSYIGEGHSVRSEFLPDTTITLKLWVLTKSMVKFILLKIPAKIIPLILFSLPWYYAGKKAGENGLKISEQIGLNKLLMASIAGVMFMALLTFAPLAWLMSEMGPERAWSHLSWVLYFTASGLFFFLGNRNTLTQFQRKSFQRISGALLLVFVIVNCQSAFRSANIYSEAWDSRMERLKTEIRTSYKDTVTIDKNLPAPGWFHTAEISSVPEHFTNQHLKKYLVTDKEIMLSNPERED